MSQNLFTPLRVGDLSLPNRLVMAPLTRSRAGAGNVPTALNALYYAQRASAGLIVSEASQVAATGQGYPATPGIHSDAQLAGWRLVTQAVHANGGRIVLQLWHVGRISHSTFQPDHVLPVAPSAIRPAGQVFTGTAMVDYETPRALTLDEISGLVQAYADGASRAIAAGFDGVEIHAANGYLIDQFLRDSTNQRTDADGGSIDHRTRFLEEVMSAVVARVGAGRTGIRISPEGTFNIPADSNAVALFDRVIALIQSAGLAYVHVIEGDMAGGPGAGIDYARIRSSFGGAYIANNAFDHARAAAAIETGKADAVAFGKAFLANPDLVTRFLLDAPLNEHDASTFYGGGAKGYTDYPELPAI